MARDGRYDRTAKLTSLEDRLEALERVNVERGIGKPSTKQEQAIIFLVANMALFEEMIEKCRATV